MKRFKVKLKPQPIVKIPTGLYKQIQGYNYTSTYKELTLEEIRKAMTELYFRDTYGTTSSGI